MKINIDEIKRRSVKAICGAFEREIVVKPEKMSMIKKELRDSGYMIVGTGDAGFGKKKIWFNPRGLSL